MAPATSLPRAPRRPGLAPLLWRSWPATGPLVLSLALSWGLERGTGLGAAAALAVGCGAVLTTTAARGNLHARRAAVVAGWRSWRESRGVMRDRYVVAPADVHRHEQGQFEVGPQVWPPANAAPAVYDAWGDDGPHFLVAGPTGYGKSEFIIGRILQALAMGWRVVVLDGKGGTEFDWSADLANDDLAVHQEPDQMQKALRELTEDMGRRYSALKDVRVPWTDTTGVVRAVVPKNVRQLLAAGIDVGGPEWQPVLLVVDEFDALTKHPKLGEQNAAYMTSLSARTRGAAIHLLLATQAPYADIMDGFVKQNVTSRAQFGPATQVQADMVIGEPARQYLAAQGAPVDRPRGRCVLVGVGGQLPRIAQANLVDVAQIAPTLEEWETRTTDATADDAQAAPGEVVVGQDVAAEARARLRLLPGGAADSRPGALPRGSVSGGRVGGGGDATPDHGPPEGGRKSAGATLHPLPSPLDVARGAAPAAEGHRARRGLAGAALRLVLVTPTRRVWLRWYAWRLVLGPRLRGGAIERDPGVRRAERERTGGVCECCYRAPTGERGEGWQAEHRRPKWAGGSDDPANLWTLCTRCHAIKTAAEQRARKWRDRTFGQAALERTPGYVWGGIVASGVATWHATLGGRGAWLGPVLAALLLWGFWRTRPRDRVDGIDNMVEKAETMQPGVLGDYATGRARLIRSWHRARLCTAVVCVAYLAVRVAFWVVPLLL